MAAPTDITGLARRWRADSIGQADNTAVASWPALTGGTALAQGTSANRPAYRTGVVNGQPVVRFDGADDYLSASITAQAQPFTVSFVMRWNSTSAFAEVFDAGGDTELIILPDQWDAFSGNDLAGGSNPGTTSWYVVTYTANGSASTLHLNGASIAAGNAGAQRFGTPLVLGRKSSGIRYMSADVAEMVVYSRALSTAERATLHSYAQDRYAVTVSDYVPTSSTIGKLRVGSSSPTAMRVGTTTVTKAYLGSAQVWP